MRKLLVICGPTAMGKTSLGIKLAKKYNGEIVSADSRQVYKGMDIGTGKDMSQRAKLKVKSEKLKVKVKGKLLKPYRFDGIPVWLLDIVVPDCQFNVADYVRCADLVIKDIWKRGELPILVGGTGFYIKAVVDGVETMGVEQDIRLREKLGNWKIGKLQEELKKLNSEKWERMNESDRKNPRRLVRAIEIVLADAKLATLKILKGTEDTEKDVLMIGLMIPNDVLYKRIDKRVDERIKQGTVKEIKGLLRKGYSWENSVLGTTIGYKEWKEYFKIQDTRYKIQNTRDIIQRWKYDEHGYARRQMTWFRKDKRINWFDIVDKKWQDKHSLISGENKVEILVERWYSKNTCRKK